MKSTKSSQSTSIDRSYQSPPPRKKPKAQESQKSKSPITSFRCICNWGNYTYQGMKIPVWEFMFNQFQTHLKDGHPWKNQLIKFTTGTTVKSLAFKAATVFEIFKDLIEERRAISMSTDISEIQKVSIFPPDMTIDEKMKSWLNIIGKAENWIKEWFRKIILGQAGVMFDSLCQKINLKQKGLVKYAESKMAKEQGKKTHLDVRDANKILGWAIFYLRLKKNQMINSIEEEEGENDIQLRKEIDFLSSMRFYAEEALQSQVYLDKCYDSFLGSSNRGRLTLVLMKKVSASVDQEKLDNDHDVTANAKDDILKNDELLEVFLDCSKGNVYLEKLSEKKKIFAELVDKVIKQIQ
eukprot:jgi/Psemu1/639/gm1.639_g